MARAVQAGSLATVIDLADNPPERLHYGLLQDVQQPLTLYIARVPGSRGEPFCLNALNVYEAYNSHRCLPDNNEAPTESCHRVGCSKLPLLRPHG